ncbi:MAG TPA: peptide chain release factor N(5)-glutamine methyltransferase [Thermodesulfobacteriota bacterium]|nr:peptide chain release factor N(5)-glutamine methyltransferase [Thermodesulfobacteriota bacterium]
MASVAEKMWTIREILSWAEDYLAGYEVPDAKIETEYLLAHALDCKRTELYLNHENHLSDYVLQEFIGFVERRIKREPSQYIIGEQEFWGLPFKVNSDVLIPRPETELMVEEARKTVAGGQWTVDSKNKRNSSLTTHHLPLILDLCTGSGCIGISIAKEIPACHIYAVDVSEKAMDVVMENAERHDVAGRITFLQGNMFEPLNGLNIKADIIVSNPPYISKKMMVGLEPEVKDYEPVAALYGGDDGLDFYRRIISESPAYLTQGGHLILEMGYGQAEEIKKLIKQNNVFEQIDIKKDLAGIDRVIKAQRKG